MSFDPFLFPFGKRCCESVDYYRTVRKLHKELDYYRSVLYSFLMSRITDVKELGTLVRDRRKEKGLTQSDLAMYCNTGIRFISDLENGKPTMQISKVLTILSMLALNVYVEER